MTAQASVQRGPFALTPAARRRFVRRNGWTIGVWVIFFILVLIEKLVKPSLSSDDLLNMVSSSMPLVFATMAQTAVVLVGGIDLSVGAMMALVNVVAATYMLNGDFRQSILVSLIVMIGTTVVGALTGFLITISRVPDIIVTLATSFVWTGLALHVMEIPGGGVPLSYMNLVLGQVGGVIPEGLLLTFGVLLVVWLPFFRSRLGLRIYAMGSSRNAAFLSGVNVAWTRIMAYALGGLFAGLAGLALTAYVGAGDPNSSANYTLNSVAAVVFGGVSLTGGKGGMIGPVLAAFILSGGGIISSILAFKSVDPNYSTVIQGAIVVIVVLIAGLTTLRRES